MQFFMAPRTLLHTPLNPRAPLASSRPHDPPTLDPSLSLTSFFCFPSSSLLFMFLSLDVSFVSIVRVCKQHRTRRGTTKVRESSITPRWSHKDSEAKVCAT